MKFFSMFSIFSIFSIRAAAPIVTALFAAASGRAPLAAQSAPAAPAPNDRSRPGLYVDGAFQAAMSLRDAIGWLAGNAKAGGNYGITLGKHEAIPPCSLSYDNEKVTITLKGAGGPWEITYNTAAPSASLFRVGAGVTFIMEEGVTLKGLPANNERLVSIEGGVFAMRGGAITGNTAGGVLVIDGGVFTMKGGAISGNTREGSGGGVFMRGGGAFTMHGGIISGNTARSFGGGVVVLNSGVFAKSGGGGVIYGSNASGGQANQAGQGAAVFARDIKRDTTAGISTTLDTGKRGAASGWD